MKNTLIITVFTACGLMGSAQPMFVDTMPSDKNVIIEQFVRKNLLLPELDNVVNRLISDNPNRVFGISIHDYPSISLIDKDFTCEDGFAFMDYFNIDFSNSLLGMANRGNIADMENIENRVIPVLSQPSCLNVAAKGEIDWNLRQLTLTVEVYYTGNSNVNENYLTVALLQNNIEDRENGATLNPDQVLPNKNYNFLRVLRDIISPTWGDTIETTTQSTFFTKTYTYTIPDTIESKLPAVYKNRSIRPEVLLENLEVIVFESINQR